MNKESDYTIEQWEKDNDGFLTCDKGDVDLLIDRMRYGYGGRPGALAVFLFDKGELIYEDNGDVYCLINRAGDYPKIGDCMQLCEEEEDEEEGSNTED